MSVTIRPYRGGGWEVDIRVVSPDGTRQKRERKHAPISSRMVLAPLEARGASKGDPGARRACGSDHDPALHAPQSGSPRRGDRAAGSAVRRTKLWRYVGNGESVAKMINEYGD